jgi:hypothetical protein
MVQDPRIQNQQGDLESGSQLPRASPAPEFQGGTNSATMPQHPEAFSDLGSHKPSGSELMEVDKPNPPGRGRTV